ncbi:hypothetical protein Scep_006288 [Stephania cephalantha]|uniref:Uncharacterized protein n=1 Tax=Stephania cephalantha TaxID=152367 RepID=A0AAP0K7R2_9MAGN
MSRSLVKQCRLALSPYPNPFTILTSILKLRLNIHSKLNDKNPKKIYVKFLILLGRN